MSKKKIILSLLIAVLIVVLSFSLWLFVSLAPVSTNESLIEFTINSGDSKSDIIDDLEDAGVIKNSFALKVYLLLNLSSDLMAGDYIFDTSLSASEILKQIQNGDYEIITKDSISVTFVEGERLTEYAHIIANNFNFEYNEVIEVMNDDEYLASLVSKYSILTDEILDEDLYYPLEGYLFPDTYEFHIDASIEDIIEKMIDHTATVLSSETLMVSESDYTVHEILTMASITELEANSASDRYTVAEVIYNRLDIGMTLGMDVTSYYGVQMDMGDTLTYNELNDDNPYNTRNSAFYGLPVGAICNPSLSSIIAVLYPSEGDNLYFFADIDTGKVNFFESYTAFYEYAYGV